MIWFFASAAEIPTGRSGFRSTLFHFDPMMDPNFEPFPDLSVFSACFSLLEIGFLPFLSELVEIIGLPSYREFLLESFRALPWWPDLGRLATFGFSGCSEFLLLEMGLCIGLGG